MNKKIIIIIVIAILALGTGAFFLLKKGKEEPINEIDEIKEPEVIQKVNIVDVNSKSRPYAVMVNNLNDARQVQSGLSKAYIVYEIIVEGGITRYLALFKDPEDVTIGSVRSSRHYYLDYALENDAIYVHWGWSPQAQEDIKTLKINNINGLTYEGKYFYRDNPLHLSSEHTGFTNSDKLKEATAKLKYKDTTDKGLLLNYSPLSIDYSEITEVSDAKKIQINYSNYTKNTYEYNPETGLYARFVNGKVQKDYKYKVDLTVKNIIAYEVDNYQIKGDNKGRQFLDNIGKGTGYLFTEGKSIKINWSKKDRASKTIYTYENGDEIKVNDGNTFIQIYPKTGSLKVE